MRSNDKFELSTLMDIHIWVKTYTYGHTHVEIGIKKLDLAGRRHINMESGLRVRVRAESS